MSNRMNMSRYEQKVESQTHTEDARVSISFTFRNLSGIPTADYLSKFFQQMATAGEVTRFNGKVTEPTVTTVQQWLEIHGPEGY